MKTNFSVEEHPQNPGIVDSAKHPHIVGVTSSKGGVGKSFVTCLLATELSKRGASVGILDANFHAASIPLFFGIKGPIQVGQYSFLPLQTASGIKVISANLIADDDSRTIVWKEELAGNVIEQLYKEVEWGSLDYLLVDLPSTTSELAVSIMQIVPFTGIVVVTQPTEISTKLVSKAIRATQEIGLNIVGLVENMAYYQVPVSNENMNLFGNSCTDALASNTHIPVLSRIPFLSENSILCDKGKIEDVILLESAELCQNLTELLSKISLKKAAPHPIHTEVEEIDELNVNPVEEELFIQESSANEQYFSDIVIQLIRNEDNVGAMEKPDAQGHYLGKCGDRMQIDLQIVHSRILSAKFLADGCGATQACGSMITKMACSKTMEEAEKITPDDVIVAVGGLPDDHLHCAELAVMTLRDALIDAIEGHSNSRIL